MALIVAWLPCAAETAGGRSSSAAIQPARAVSGGGREHPATRLVGHTGSSTRSSDPPALQLRSNSGPQDRSFPAAVILGTGKCGTNALASALQRIGLVRANNGYSFNEEKQRLGYTGEINWPCNRWDSAGLEEYKKHFPQRYPDKKGWLQYYDKSTNTISCPFNVSRALPPEVKLFAVLCDPMQAIWSRMNHRRSEIGVNGSNATVLINTVRRRLRNHGGPDSDVKDITCDKLAQGDPLFDRNVCYQLNAGLQYATWADGWSRAWYSQFHRVKFLLAERSLKNPMYFVREAAKHLNIKLPENPDIDKVHSNADNPAYLPSEGPQWDRFVALAAPALLPVAEALHSSMPDLFGLKGVDQWWPWAKRPLPPSHAVTVPKQHWDLRPSPAASAGPEAEPARVAAPEASAQQERPSPLPNVHALPRLGLDPPPARVGASEGPAQQESSVAPSPLPDAAAQSAVGAAGSPQANGDTFECQSINVLTTDGWCQDACAPSRPTRAPACADFCCCEAACRKQSDPQASNHQR